MTQPPKDDSIVVDTLDDFIHILVQWHTHKVAQLNHFRDIPEGTTVENNDGKEILLQGDVLEAFKLGVFVSLNHLGELPFAIELADAPESE